MLEILRPTGSEGALWQLCVDNLQVYRRDIHYTSAYARVQSCLGDVYAAVWACDGEYVLQPFMLRNDGHNDIASLYGFGGPVSSLDGLNWAKFDEEFSSWRQQHGILCEYGQLSPFLHTLQRQFIGLGFETTHLKDVVTVDLPKDNDVLLKSFSRNRQRGIKAAQERGVIVWPSTNWQHFGTMYRQSMRRLHAAERWFYPDTIWQSYLSELGQDHCVLLKSFTYDGGEEGMLLLVYGYGRAYAHFLATNTQESNDLLYFEAMKYCRNAGSYVFHIGGGTTADPNDSLLAYKSSFSKTHTPVYVYKRVFDEAGYSKACEGLAPTSFFPAYRAVDVNGTAAHQT